MEYPRDVFRSRVLAELQNGVLGGHCSFRFVETVASYLYIFFYRIRLNIYSHSACIHVNIL